MPLVKTPAYIPLLLNNYTWQVSTQRMEVFLTFDDGPTPGITEWVLAKLREYGALATFFLVGKNVLKYPELVRKIVRQGHSVGNHTFTHRNGWLESPAQYLKEIRKTDYAIRSTVGFKPRLFRPPYGKINFIVSPIIRRSHEVVMWDILARDFDPNLSASACIGNVIDNYLPGSTIVLHDSRKCAEKLRIILPALLEHFSSLGIQLSAL